MPATPMPLLINFPLNNSKELGFLLSVLYFLQVLWLPGQHTRPLLPLVFFLSFFIGGTSAAIELTASPVEHGDVASVVIKERLIGGVIPSPAWLCQKC